MGLTITVIIPTYNRFAALRDVLGDLSRQTRLPDEIIVVDQSRDADGRPLDRRAELADIPNLRYLYQAIPNAQKARNRAIRDALGEIVLLLDDDVRLPPNLVAAHLRNYEQDPTVDGVSGQVLEKQMRPTSELPSAMQWPYTGWMFFPQSHSERTLVINWPSCNASVRKTLALAVGGFDEQFVYTWWDDADFSWRLNRAGAKIVFDPDASLVHLKDPSGGKRPVRAGERVRVDKHCWAMVFYYWRKNFGLWRVWRHVWSWTRAKILCKPLLRRPHWLLLSLYHLAAGYCLASRRLREGPIYLRDPGSSLEMPAPRVGAAKTPVEA